jgi:uncharacterized membrane protein
MNMPWYVKLLNSRKFWLSMSGVISVVTLYALGVEIDPETLANAITTIVSALVLAIAGEDAARYLAAKRSDE